MDDKILEPTTNAAGTSILGGINKALWGKIAIGVVGVSTLGIVTVTSVGKNPVTQGNNETDSLYAAIESAYYQDELRKQQAANKPRSAWQSDTTPLLAGIDMVAQSKAVSPDAASPASAASESLAPPPPPTPPTAPSASEPFPTTPQAPPSSLARKKTPPSQPRVTPISISPVRYPG